jgi:lipopolysaccharide assembly outer membrane protein LptD (OstA)
MGAVLVALAAAPSAAQEARGGPGSGLFRPLAPGIPVELRSDSLEYESSRNVYVARGDVVIRQGGRQLSADWMAFNNTTRRGVASGNVVFTDGVDTIHTEFAEFELDTLKGALFVAEFVTDRGFELRGQEIRKTGERTWAFREGEFTTCRCPDPEAREPWEIQAEEADLEIEGYGTARNTTLEVLGVPVLWLPWMIYPLKTERQSGLLFPDLAVSGRNGVEIGLPVFWAAGDPVNVIATPRWLQKRGAKGDLDVEYVVGERSGGHLFGSGLYDLDVDPDSLQTPFDAGRWGTNGEHALYLPGEVTFRSRYAFVSDNAYTNDFSDLSRYRPDRFVPARAFAARGFGATRTLGLVAGAQFHDDQMNPDDTDRDRFLLNRLPEAHATALPRALPFFEWLVPAVDVRYAWYQQGQLPDRAYDAALLVGNAGRFLDTGIDGLPTDADGTRVEQGRDGSGAGTDPNGDNFDPVLNPGGTEGDGVFQEGELLADGGSRALFTPRLGAPVRLFDLVELYPEVGWHETLYQGDEEGFERRGLVTARADLRTRLRGRVFGVSHLVEPRVGWAFVNDVGQGDNPLFVPRTAVPQQRLREIQLENVTRDWADRIGAANGVSFGVGNRLYGSARSEGGAAPLLADFVLQALYDIEDGEMGEVVLDGRAQPFPGLVARFNLAFDPDPAQVNEGLLELAFEDRRGDSLALGYRYLRRVPAFFEAFPRQNRRFDDFEDPFDHVNQIDAAARLAITANWALVYSGVYSFERELFIGNQGGVEYISRCGCWAVRVEVADSRSRGPSVSVRYTLLGLGDDSRRPFQSGGRSGPLGFLDGLGGV